MKLSLTVNVTTIFLTWFLFTSISLANGQDRRFYSGLGISSVAAEEGGISTQELGLTVVGGYSYSQYLSTEFSFFNLGEHKELAMKGNGLTLSVIGSYPIIDNLKLFAELGLMSVNVDIDESVKVIANTTDEDLIEDGIDTSIYYGIGAKYQFKDWSLLLKTTVADLDADLNIISLQAHYHF